MTDRSATLDEAQAGVRSLMTRAAGADARARAALAASIDDAFLPADGRLDDRTRAALGALIAAMIGAIEGELVERVMRSLTNRGDAATAARLTRDAVAVADRLMQAGVLREEAFVGECLARVRLELLSAAMPVDAGPDADAPSLLARLAQSTDRVVATAAAAVMIGESQRRAIGETGTLSGTGLPAALHARLVWWVAAALRERAAAIVDDSTVLDRAIADAARRNLSSQDDGDRLEAAAMRLAAAIDAQPAELPTLVEEVLRDRRLTVLAAFLAHALCVHYGVARDLIVDPVGDRLWLVLRALDLPRSVIARVGFLLCEADPARDVEAFADTLDVIASVDAVAARLAIAPLQLHPDYRAAMLDLNVPVAPR